MFATFVIGLREGLDQRAFSTDILNECIRHVGSAIFVVLPGATPRGFVGESLLA